jgi:hypothetical protein
MPALPYNAAPAPTIAGGGSRGSRPGSIASRRARGRVGAHGGSDGRDAAARVHDIMHLLVHGPTQLCMSGESWSVRHRHWIPQSAAWAPTLPGAERGTVNGMLPDFRFVLGAILAIALLAVAGLGLVTSVQLVREARMAPLGDSRTLAFAGHAEWNQFYDPDGARRFEGLAGKPEGQLAPALIETPVETSVIAPLSAPLSAPLGPEARTASIPAPGLEPDLAHDDIAQDKTPQTNPPPMGATPAAMTVAVVPGETVGVPAPDAPGTTASGTPPPVRVASAPATSPGPDLETPAPAQAQAAGDPLPDSAPPTPRARPKIHFRKRIARAHFRRIVPTTQQTWPNSGFPTAAPWPGSDTQFTGTTKKTTGKLTGTLSNRPQ